MRRFLGILGISIGALCLLMLLACALALTVEIEIPLGGQRERITRAPSDAAGAPVTVSGPLKAYTGPRAGFEVGQIHFGAVMAASAIKVDTEPADGRPDCIAACDALTK